MHTEASLSSEKTHQAGNDFSPFSPARPTVPGVTAELTYLSPTIEQPYTFMYQPPDGAPWDNCQYRVMRVQISDARAMTSQPSIDVEGFELWDAPTSVINFVDENAIQRYYYPEATELARKVTGADCVLIFDHAVRQREAGRPALNFGRNGSSNHLGAVGRVHVDYTEASGQRRLELAAVDHPEARQPRRFAIVNIWRSIRGKVMDTPLALCDSRSVSAQDLITAELRYPSRNGELYLVRQSPRHQWAYFPQMDNCEALIFKQYDSQVNSVARFTPHSAFDLPDIPRDAPLRESIEVRCLLIYH
jgi:hypothetical protein